MVVEIKDETRRIKTSKYFRVKFLEYKIIGREPANN
jgi:hypothetical protein